MFKNFNKFIAKPARYTLISTALVFSINSHAENGFTIGLGVGFVDDIYLGGKQDETDVMPYLAYETERLHIGIDELSYALILQEDFELTVFGEPRDLDDLKRGSLFRPLKRDTAVELGLSAEYSLGPVALLASSQADVSDAHEGFETRLGIGTGLEVFKGQFQVSFSGVYRDKKLNHYLYGVSKDDAISGARLYTPKEGWSSELDATYMYPFSDKLALLAGASIEFLGDEAKDSPRLVKDTERATSAFIGLLWRF